MKARHCAIIAGPCKMRALEAQTKAAAAQAPVAPGSAAPAVSILPSSWQLYTVSAVFGVVLLALGYWQVSELLRRVRRRPIE